MKWIFNFDEEIPTFEQISYSLLTQEISRMYDFNGLI